MSLIKPTGRPWFAFVMSTVLFCSLLTKEIRAQKRQGRVLKNRFRKQRHKPLGRSGHHSKKITNYQKLKETIQDTLGGRWLGGSDTSFIVADAHTGKEILSFLPTKSLNPASNVKLISTATTLSVMDPSWMYQTRFFSHAPNKKGEIDGGIYLYGDWDPMFGINNLKKLVRKLKDRGVTTIRGGLWMDPIKYRDRVNTLVRIELKTPTRGKKKPEITVWPDTDFIKVTQNLKYKKRGRTKVLMDSNIVNIDGSAKLHLHISGTARTKKRYKLRKGYKDEPQVSAMMVLDTLAKAGIKTDGAIVLKPFDEFTNQSLTVPSVLAIHQSKPVGELIALINKNSINWLADTLIKTAFRQKTGGEPTMDGAITAMHQWLESIGVSSKKLLIDTGSGLSYNTQLTTRQIVRVIRAGAGYSESEEVTYDPAFFIESLAVGGVDGTLKGRFKNDLLKGAVIGKTGTLTKIIALSGILRLDNANDLIFSIVTNGSNHRHRNDVRRDHEYLIRLILDYVNKEKLKSEQSLKSEDNVSG